MVCECKKKKTVYRKFSYRKQLSFEKRKDAKWAYQKWEYWDDPKKRAYAREHSKQMYTACPAKKKAQVRDFEAKVSGGPWKEKSFGSRPFKTKVLGGPREEKSIGSRLFETKVLGVP